LPAAADAATVLLVDGERGVRELLGAMLATQGYSVLEADSGPEALRLSQQHPGKIDLLLTDIMIPGMDGPELAAAFSVLRPDARVLFVSASAPVADDRRAAVADQERLILKPFSRHELAGHVREALRRGRADSEAG
jgi:CheY-like chemotaxis protein